jgi:hypothetical protein
MFNISIDYSICLQNAASGARSEYQLRSHNKEMKLCLGIMIDAHGMKTFCFPFLRYTYISAHVVHLRTRLMLVCDLQCIPCGHVINVMLCCDISIYLSFNFLMLYIKIFRYVHDNVGILNLNRV